MRQQLSSSGKIVEFRPRKGSADMRTTDIRNGVACLIWVLAAATVFAADPFAADEELLKTAGVQTDGPSLLEFFRKRTIDGSDVDRIKQLIKQLGNEDFEAREAASGKLAAIGVRAKPFLKDAANDPDVEVAKRAKECLQKVDQGSGSQTVAAAARLLARRKPDRAVEVLLTYLPSADDDKVAEEVRQALGVLALKDGKIDPTLVAALTDKSPVKRAAAAVAFGQAKAKEQVPALRKLLQDPEPLVRARAGLSLAALHDKEAVPLLIDLLGELPSYENNLVEDLLDTITLADDKAPAGNAGSDAASRKKYREAWKIWWTEHGAKLDLAKVEEASKPLGNTLVVLLDKGKVVDLDKNNKPRFEVENLDFPLDAQLLPEDHILVAEHNGGRVTERDKKGEIVWEKKVDGPLVAQRLPDGNTFICTRTQLLEYDKDGKSVYTYNSPRGEQFMKAMKLRNGDYAFIGQLGVTRFVRMTPQGKEIASFPVDVRTSGGRIDVTRKGHVLVPENGTNRVVEYDASGKVVWEVGIEQPIAALRLPNGNTIVTSMNQLRAVEFDRSGRELWEFKSDTRVTRAIRR
jgi:HEAT repeats/PQQ-like domain